MEVVSSFWFNTQFTLARMPHVLKLKTLNPRILAPAIPLSFENDHYVVKTADTIEEIIQVLALRFEVFFREFSTQKVSFSLFPYDIDMHDFMCDHLIVKDKDNNQVIACYRLLSCSSDKKEGRYYSEGEFDLSEFLNLPGTKLELGRACVHKDYRKGTVISLLWKGLLQYARLSGARYMFGCSSVNRKDFENFPSILAWLEANNGLIKDYSIGIAKRYRVPFDLKTDGGEPSSKGMASLMQMYVLAGAKMARTPAYDKEMDCLDMFTVIDLKEMPQSFERKFRL